MAILRGQNHTPHAQYQKESLRAVWCVQVWVQSAWWAAAILTAVKIKGCPWTILVTLRLLKRSDRVLWEDGFSTITRKGVCGEGCIDCHVHVCPQRKVSQNAHRYKHSSPTFRVATACSDAHARTAPAAKDKHHQSTRCWSSATHALCMNLEFFHENA